ncbi:hypothetical protein ACFWUW_09545 [Streptomyces sp. NPDC058655]|uniref:hypothetical protein n=1 Tax=Streptomyces sp. NPDC058655 TaxID=3346577 RepID=UPI003663A24C
MPGSPVGAGSGEAAGSACLGPAPAAPDGIDPSVRETGEETVRAVRDGDDTAIRTLEAKGCAGRVRCVVPWWG